MALEKAVAGLPDGFRKVFLLHDGEGLKHEEIAEILGCSAATSRSQLCRARLALREQLKPMLAKEHCA
jgi:RNA polymerase sigma-70 factor (ECF subfamily)